VRRNYCHWDMTMAAPDVGTSVHSWSGQESPGIAVAVAVALLLLPKDPEPEGQEQGNTFAAAAVAVAPVLEQGRRRTDRRNSQMPSKPSSGEEPRNWSSEQQLEHPTVKLVVVAVVGAPQFQRMGWRVVSPLPIAADVAVEAVHIAAGAVAGTVAGTGVADTGVADTEAAVLDCRHLQEAC
jgi:hypothetical protein